ncbi:hypothetical protein N7534_009632 [Penicillium rubens]|nr:hypothetical protein N7534_009632 [Penicillium rubens]
MQEPTYDPSRPMPSIEIAYSYKLVDIPNKTMVSLRIEFPPNGSTPPPSAWGRKRTVLNKMNEEPMKTIQEGGSWFEAPGCHHRISDNASKTEAATLIATMVTDTEVFERDGMGALIQIDEEYRK